MIFVNASSSELSIITEHGTTELDNARRSSWRRLDSSVGNDNNPPWLPGRSACLMRSPS
jgi:hypothetical protein